MRALHIFVTIALLAVAALSGCATDRSPFAYGNSGDWSKTQEDPYAVPAAPNDWTHQPVHWTHPEETVQPTSAE